MKSKTEICQQKAEYYQKNKEQIKVKNSNYYITNKERIKIRAKEYYIKNKDKINKKQSEYYQKNKDKVMERCTERYQLKKEEIIKKQLEKYHQNPESERRRARATNLLVRIQLFDQLGGKCVKCGFNDIRALQFDHIDSDFKNDLKRFRSVYSMRKYYVENPTITQKKLQVLCANCNWIKKHEKNEVRTVWVNL